MKVVLALVGSSGLQVALSAILGMLLAWMLPADQFGITRVVTSYMVILSICGHCTLHDAASTFVATAADRRHASAYYHSALWLVALISTVVATGVAVAARYSGWWPDPMAGALCVSALSLPFIAVSIVGAAVLQASGSYLRMVANQVLAGAVPLVIILPSAWHDGLQGWVYGRYAATVAYCLATFGCLAGLFELRWPSRHHMRELLRFSRYQLVSGLLSLFLMSADVIILERVTHDLVVVAQYGLASLFIKSLFFIPSAIGRAYFREIAEARSGSGLMSAAARFAGISCLGVMALYLLMVAASLGFMHEGIMNKYRGALYLVLWLGPSALLGTLWQVASVVNIGRKRPLIAMHMSLVASAVMLLSGYLLTVALGPAGTAMALGLAYLCGLAMGLWSWSTLRLP